MSIGGEANAPVGPTDVQIGLYQVPIFAPHYALREYGAWRVGEAKVLMTPGYWSPLMLVENVAALHRGTETWMSTIPMEIESQEIGVRLARGHVVIFGLGMGWSAGASALQPEVTAVTVVERDPEVLELHRQLDIFAQLPDEARAKIRIEQGDAFDWKPSEPVDLLMPDIWLPLMSDGRVEEVRAMQANVQAKAIYFWGQELEIARHAIAAGRALDDAGIAATIAAFDLPLIGADYPDYAGKLRSAAANWMRDRWLPGSVPPDLTGALHAISTQGEMPK